MSLIYFSHANQTFSEPELLHLLRVCRLLNERDGITGMLLYHEGSFVQALEGPADGVGACFSRISKDPRHSGIVSTRIAIESREFASWSMGFLSTSSQSQADLTYVNKFMMGDGATEKTVDISVAWVMLKSFRDNVFLKF